MQHEIGIDIAMLKRHKEIFMIDYLQRLYIFCKDEPLWVVAFIFCGFINGTAFLTL